MQKTLTLALKDCMTPYDKSTIGPVLTLTFTKSSQDAETVNSRRSVQKQKSTTLSTASCISFGKGTHRSTWSFARTSRWIQIHLGHRQKSQQIPINFGVENAEIRRDCRASLFCILQMGSNGEHSQRFREKLDVTSYQESLFSKSSISKRFHIIRRATLSVRCSTKPAY